MALGIAKDEYNQLVEIGKSGRPSKVVNDSNASDAFICIRGPSSSPFREL
jgi:hypothetical protein